MSKAMEVKVNCALEVIRHLRPNVTYSPANSTGTDRQSRESLSGSEAVCYEAALKVVAGYLKG